VNDYDPLWDYLKRQTLIAPEWLARRQIPARWQVTARRRTVFHSGAPHELPIRRPACGEDEAAIVFGGSTPPMPDSLFCSVSPRCCCPAAELSTGAFQNAMMPSPMNLSNLPPWQPRSNYLWPPRQQELQRRGRGSERRAVRSRPPKPDKRDINRPTTSSIADRFLQRIRCAVASRQCAAGSARAFARSAAGPCPDLSLGSTRSRVTTLGPLRS
jgi:hypothetical protein